MFRNLIISISVFFIVGALTCACAESNESTWLQVLRTTRYADVIRASFGQNCRNSEFLERAPKYKLVCGHLDKIPNNIIESAALPYLKANVDKELANQAISFWASPEGRALTDKIIVEIDSGVMNQLTKDDLILLNKANKTNYGMALSAFSKNKEVSNAVIQAMFSYEP